MVPRVRLSIFYQFDIFGTKVGGIETFIKGFVKFAPDDFEVELVGLTENREQRKAGLRVESEYGGRPIFYHPVLYARDPNYHARVPLSLKYTLALMRRRVEVTGRILEFHRLEPALAFWTKKNPRGYTCHLNLADLADTHAEAKWKKAPWLYFQLEKRLIRTMDLIYVVNQSGLEFYQERYPKLASRMRFTPTWVDETVFHPLEEHCKKEEAKALRERMGLDQDGALILFAGRFDPQKDPLLLLESFNTLKTLRPRDALLLVGEGELRPRMERYVRDAALQDSVLFLGKMDQPDLAGLMRTADLFALTSGFEGMPMCVLEALGSGLPAVSTKVTGVDRVLRENFSGIIADDRKAGTLARAMALVLDQKEKYTPSNCLAAVEKYQARTVLAPIYQARYELAARTA